MARINKFLVDIPQLPSEASQVCEGLMTYTEWWNAIPSMKNEKSPGLDCLHVKFYKAFFMFLGTFIANVEWRFSQRKDDTENAATELSISTV